MYWDTTPREARSKPWERLSFSDGGDQGHGRGMCWVPSVRPLSVGKWQVSMHPQSTSQGCALPTLMVRREVHVSTDRCVWTDVSEPQVGMFH